MSETQFSNPDALAYASGKPSASAQIKQEPEDFKVDEELGFEPTGEGEHLYLRIAKRNLSTTDVASLLSRSLNVATKDIGYAGMKDRRAVTSQWFSVKSPRQDIEDLSQLNLPPGATVDVVESVRNQRKLKIGSHRLNHFRILLSKLDGDKTEVEKKLGWLRDNGFPNYFGSQRFGKNLSNLEQVQKLFDETKADQDTPRKPNRKRTSMLFSAARSYLFNHILSERIGQACWNKYVPGDVLNLDGTSRNFNVDLGAWDSELEQRLETMDIHPTGLLCGIQSDKDNYVTCAQAADIENAIVASFPSLAEGLQRHGLQAARRPLRTRVTELRWQWTEDQSLSLHFSLPRGAYATSFLRELCQVS